MCLKQNATNGFKERLFLKGVHHTFAHKDTKDRFLESDQGAGFFEKAHSVLSLEHLSNTKPPTATTDSTELSRMLPGCVDWQRYIKPTFLIEEVKMNH